MKRTTTEVLRVHQPRTSDEFMAGLKQIFRPRSPVLLSTEQVLDVWRRHRSEDEGRPKVVWDNETQMIVGFLYPVDRSTGPSAACGIHRSVPLPRDAPALVFARHYTSVFNIDLKNCSEVKRTDELWSVLHDSRFARALARYMPFENAHALDWLQAMERSMALRYEGDSMRHCVLVTNDHYRFSRRWRHYLSDLSGPLTFQQALLGEKWIRRVVDGKRVVLVATPKGKVMSMLSLAAVALEEAIDPSLLPPYAPHESLLPLQYLMGERDIALMLSPVGDFHVIFGTGVVFQKVQGRWNFNHYDEAQKEIKAHVDKKLVVHLLRAALDLSFERKGALLCVLDPGVKERIVVIDPANASRANCSLRQAVRGLDITKWTERQIIAAAATTDGAVVFDRHGRVVDVAAMIASFHSERWRDLGFKEPLSFEGARSTAAWHASLWGLAIKVSEDGPITIWRHGRQIAALNGE